MAESSVFNPAVINWQGPHGLPQFEQVGDDDYAPAFEAALREHEAEIDAIADNSEPPTFANTILALEIAGDALSRVSALFWNRAGAHTNPGIQALKREIAPKMSRHYSKIGMNAALFARIDDLWTRRDALNLTLEETRVLERHWKGFVKSGAKLPKAEQSGWQRSTSGWQASAPILARMFWRMNLPGSCLFPERRTSRAFPHFSAMPWPLPRPHTAADIAMW